MQTKDYYQIGILTLNYIIVYKSLVLNRNTWNHIAVQTNNYRQIKVKFKNAIEY